MTAITEARAYLVDVEVESVRVDAVQSFVKQETVFVELDTDDGLTGTGYCYTIGTGGRSVLAMLQQHLLGRLVGRDAAQIEKIWFDSLRATRATAVGAITSLSLSAIDTALWDLKAKRADAPLWIVAGGFRGDMPLYDTEHGWLNLSIDELTAGVRGAREAGWGGFKIKIGNERLADDLERVLAVREAAGDELQIMVDANQSMTTAEAIRRAHSFEPANLSWLEEPLPADDVSGHARLARSTSTPIAVGESIYSLAQFREYLERGAVGIVQPDVARIGGITPWLKVAHLAEAFNVAVCPHFLMELHVSLLAAIPNGSFLEYIPQLRAITHGELRVEHGRAFAPMTPGLGIEWSRDAIDDRRVT